VLRPIFLSNLKKVASRRPQVTGHKYRVKKLSVIDGLVKSRFYPVFVIPAKAGIQLNQEVLGSRLRGSGSFSDFLRDHHQLLIIGH
jgi:hypothetical protein